MTDTGPSCPKGSCALLSRHSVDLLQRRQSTPKPTFATAFVGRPAYQCGFCAWPQCGNPFADRLKNSRQHAYGGGRLSGLHM
jgi:hypothetical protein